MHEVSATDAARNFSDLLDAVEHRGERFIILRRGRVVAELQPVSFGRGDEVKALLAGHVPEQGWAEDVARVRALLRIEERG